ncbi:MAG: M23 family metallopeptidase [Bdellovibrionota bacterium]
MAKNIFRTYILGIILIVSNSCGSLETADYVGPGQMRIPNGVGTPIGKTSIVDELKLRWPVSSPRITQGFKAGSKRSRHQGIDLGGSKNTPILAAHDGKVIYTGRDFQGYGKLVIVESPNGYATFYAHLNTINTREGKWVMAGEKIGGMGRTGRATGVHLHFELRIAEVAVDPSSYFKGNRQANRTRNE